MAQVKITRSSGLSVPGWNGPPPGGGYEGLTPELDAMCVEAANRLGRVFSVEEVQVRFNADRCGGGAFILNPWGDLGITCELRQDTSALELAVFASKFWLLDHSAADQNRESFARAYAYVPVVSVIDGANWCAENCWPRPREPVDAATIKRWQHRKIRCVVNGGARIELSVLDAIRQVGNHVTDQDVTSAPALADRLVTEFHMKRGDAITVATGVFQIGLRAASAER